MDREINIIKNALTPEGVEARDFLEKVATLLENSGQFEVRIRISFSDDVPELKDLKPLDTHILEVVAKQWDDEPDVNDLNEADVYQVDLAYRFEDDGYLELNGRHVGCLSQHDSKYPI